MNESARRGSLRAAGRLQSQDVLVAIDVAVGQDLGVLLADRAAVVLCRAHAASGPATVSSTAIRTATPLLT